MASEMLYPIMPVFLSSIGFSVVLIGVLEGFAEMVAGLSKGYFGQLSDVRQKRLPFVQLGYFLSAISKPMLALFSTPVWIFFSRTIDRTGKGLRYYRMLPPKKIKQKFLGSIVPWIPLVQCWGH